MLHGSLTGVQHCEFCSGKQYDREEPAVANLVLFLLAGIVYFATNEFRGQNSGEKFRAGSRKDCSLRLPQIRTCTLMHLLRHVVNCLCPSHYWVVSR